MKTIVLSDHVGDRQKAFAAQRGAEYAAAIQAYRDRVRRHEEELSRRERELVTAVRQRNVWQAIVRFFPYVSFLFNTGPRAPAIVRRYGANEPSREERLWAVGREGEQRVSGFLGQMLNDDWTLLAGYCNPRGEIDRILVGPRGVFALEIKNLSGMIYCDGDSWWRDKYDNYGNKVEANLPIADRTGRGPSVQVNSVADVLHRFLNRIAGSPRIARAVIFPHPKAQLGEIRNPSVDFVGTLSESSINALLAQGHSSIDAELAGSIVAAIKRDHQFHQGG